MAANVLYPQDIFIRSIGVSGGYTSGCGLVHSPSGWRGPVCGTQLSLCHPPAQLVAAVVPRPAHSRGWVSYLSGPSPWIACISLPPHSSPPTCINLSFNGSGSGQTILPVAVLPCQEQSAGVPAPEHLGSGDFRPSPGGGLRASPG